MNRVEICKCPTSILVTEVPDAACACHFAIFYNDSSTKCLLNQETLYAQDGSVKFGYCSLVKYDKCPYLVDINSYLNKE